MYHFLSKPKSALISSSFLEYTVYDVVLEKSLYVNIKIYDTGGKDTTKHRFKARGFDNLTQRRMSQLKVDQNVLEKD